MFLYILILFGIVLASNMWSYIRCEWVSNGVDELTVSPSGGTAPACDSSCVAGGDCNELTPADGNPKHVKIPSAIHSYLWHLGRSQLGTCPDQIPTFKKSVCLSIAWFHPLHDHVCCEWHSTSRIPSNSSTVESPSCDLTFRLQHIRSSANVTSEMQHCHCTIISYIWYQFLLKHASFHCSSELSVWLWIWLNMHMGLY